VTLERIPISEAAARLGVPASTATYWARKAATQAQRPPKAPQARKPATPPPSSTPAFVQVIRSDAATARVEVRIGRTVIRLRRGFDAELLRAVIAVLREVVE